MHINDAARPEFSVVIPCFNEEANVAAIAQAVHSELDAIGGTYEIIFIDNASTDRTAEIVRSLCANDSRVKLIVNNRNYGQIRSPAHGIYQARGRAVMAMCADFQDPPALLGTFIARWRAGAMIVLGARRSERSAAVLRLLRSVGYRFLARFADYQVIPGATGFGLYDREVVDCLRRWREPEPFFRGMLVESGYPLEVISYDRPQRAAGDSKNNLASLMSFALSGVANSSKQLLRLPLYVGFVLCGLGALFLIAAVVAAGLGQPWSWFSIQATLQIGFGLVLFALGLLGEQVRLISERTRETPLVVERERHNF